MGRNEKLITSEHGVAVSPIAGYSGGSERDCQLCARAVHVKVLKGLCRVGTREQRCAAEERQIPSERFPARIPQADSFVPCSCGSMVASHTYSQSRGHGRSEGASASTLYGSSTSVGMCHIYYSLWKT